MGVRRKGNTNPLPSRLRDLRTARGMSQKELGVLAGIDPSAASPRINQYERGKHSPNFSVVVRIADVLGTSPAYFYADDEQLATLIAAFHSASARQRADALKLLNMSR